MTQILVQHRARWGGPGREVVYEVPGARHGALWEGKLCLSTETVKYVAQIPDVRGWRILPDLFAVRLLSSGENKINVIKALRVVHGGLGLKEAKDLVEQPAGSILVRHWPRERAERLVQYLALAGCSAEMALDYPGEPVQG